MTNSNTYGTVVLHMLNTYSSTLTSKGQATIPAPIRKELGLNPGERLLFEQNGQGVTLKTHSQLVNELYGSLKPKTNIKWNKEKAYEAVGRMLAKRYIKTLPKEFRPKVNEIT